MKKSIFQLVIISILVVSVYSNAAEKKESITSSSEISQNIGMDFGESHPDCLNMGRDVNFKNGDNDELILASSTCTCTCQCERCAFEMTCYQPAVCGSCNKMCNEKCDSTNTPGSMYCGAMVKAYGDCS